MKYLKIFCLCMVLLVSFSISEQAFAMPPVSSNTDGLKKLKYIIAYEKGADKSTLKISLEFNSGPESKTILTLPSSYGGANNLYKYISNITVIGAQIEKTKNHSELILHHQPNKHIILSYNINQSWNGPFNDSRKHLAPILQEDYFHFIGNCALIYPQHYENEKKIALQLDWKIPNGWKIANSYGYNAAHQKITTNLSDFLTALFIGGNFRFYKTPVKGGVILTAINGKWLFNEEEFSKTVVDIITTQRKFWNDYHFPYFLVSLIPVKTGAGYAGTGLTNAFSATISSNASLDYNVWHIISHENFHMWNNTNLCDLSNNSEIYCYWFDEGFTDYYSNLLNLRIGLITLPDYIKQYNNTLVNYYSSPANLYTIKQVVENFWNDSNVQSLPYQQGTVLAMNWNLQIKKITNNQASLDDFMHSLFNYAHQHAKLTPELMQNMADKFNYGNITSAINRVYTGQIIAPDDKSLGPCAHLVNRRLAPYNSGFNVKASKENHTIIALDKKSRAYAAGLRNGQRVIAIEDHPGDVTKQMTITINDSGKTKEIRYYPYKGQLKDIPQFELFPEKWLTHPEMCLSWFS